MILIACVSVEMGLTFNGRRQSRDVAVVKDILNFTHGNTLRAAPYSEKLLGTSNELTISEDYLEVADENDFCFYEGQGDIPWGKVSKVILYHWNRDYPQDKVLALPKTFSLKESTEFKGNSHDKITREVWN